MGVHCCAGEHSSGTSSSGLVSYIPGAKPDPWCSYVSPDVYLEGQRLTLGDEGSAALPYRLRSGQESWALKQRQITSNAWAPTTHPGSGWLEEGSAAMGNTSVSFRLEAGEDESTLES